MCIPLRRRTYRSNSRKICCSQVTCGPTERTDDSAPRIASSRVSQPRKTIEKEVRIQLKESILFTDSAIVLAWIRSQGRRLKPFVSSRVGEIQDNVQPVQWRHIPTEHNVADDVSRGLPVAELSDRWKNGPEYLYLPKENWPADSATPDPNEVERECGNVQVLVAATTNESTATGIIDLERFSSWKRLVRVTAWTLRMKAKFLAKTRSTDESTADGDCLTPEELKRGRLFWIKATKGESQRVQNA